MAAGTRTLLRTLSQRQPSFPSSPSSSSSSSSSSTSKEEKEEKEEEEEDTYVGGRGERDAGGHAGGLDRRSQAVRAVQDEVC